MRGWPIYPACDLTMFSVLSCPGKTLKLTGKEAFSGKPLECCFDNSPWKAGKFESGGAKHRGPALAGQVSSVPAFSCGSRLTVAFNCGTCPSHFWKLSAFSLRPGPREACGKGQATITGLFFPLKPNPRVQFCHPASNHSVTVRN